MINNVKNSSNNTCDIFICYRNSSFDDANKLYNWMKNDKLRHYGEVYFSDSKATANFKNDIKPYISVAKTIIIVADEFFTDGFPQNRETFEKGNDDCEICITAHEISAIFDRFRKESNHPNILLLVSDGNVNLPTEPFYKIASEFSEDIESGGFSNETIKIADSILSAARNKLHDRGAGYIEPNYAALLGDICVKISDFWQKNALNYYKKTLDDGEFTCFPETLLAQKIEITLLDKQKKLYSFDELADKIVNKETGSAKIVAVTGGSGMGKTTQLINLCYKRNTAEISVKTPFFFFSADALNYVKVCPEMFYSAFITNYNITSDNPKNFILTEFFDDTCKNDVSCVFVIDGLDEIKNDDALEYTLLAINEISHKGAAVIVSSRSQNHFYCFKAEDCLHAEIKALDNFDELPLQYRPSSSALTSLLKVPFYFSMYKRSFDETSSDNFETNSENTSAFYDQKEFFNFSSPTKAGELIWNYFMRHISKCRGTSNVKMSVYEYNHRFFLLYVLPRLATYMESRGENQLTFRNIQEQYIRISTDSYVKLWSPFWENEYAPKNFNVPTFADFCEFCKDHFLVFRKKRAGDYWGFSHALYFEFFKAVDVLNILSVVANCHSNEISLVENIDIFIQLREKPLSALTAKFSGDICGECYNNPIFNNDNDFRFEVNGKYGLLHRALNALRTDKDTYILSSSTLVYNIFHIIKSSRSINNAIPDMSNINFSKLDLTRCSLTNIIFSHINPFDDTKKVCASFNGAKINALSSLSGGHSVKKKYLSICAMHTWKNRLISIDDNGGIVLWDTEYRIPLFVDSVSDNYQTLCVSNIIQVKTELYVAINNIIYKIFIINDDSQFIVEPFKTLKTRAVNQLGIDENNNLYYHPFDAPLDRYNTDGTLYDAFASKCKKDGRWIPNAIVNKSGTTAYSVCNIKLSACRNKKTEDVPYNCPLFKDGYTCNCMVNYDDNELCACAPTDNFFIHRDKDFIQIKKINLDSLCEVLIWKNNSGVWKIEKTPLITLERLQKDTGFISFSNSKLYLLENNTETNMVICLKAMRNGEPKSESLILVYNLTKDGLNIDKLLGKYKISDENAPMCIASGDSIKKAELYSASYLNIFFTNNFNECQTPFVGDGIITKLFLLPDTESFAAISNNPVRVQLFSCLGDVREWKCISHIVPTINNNQVSGNLLHFDHATFAYDFKNFDFEEPHLMDHSEQLYILLSQSARKNEKLFSINVASGDTNVFDELDSICVVDSPKVCFANEDRFKLRSDFNKVKIVSINDEDDVMRYGPTLHFNWLFIGCNFEDVDWQNKELFESDLTPYISNKSDYNKATVNEVANGNGLFGSFYDDFDEEDF